MKCLLLGLLLVVGCSKRASLPLFGEYKESQCFKNAAATAGIGYDVYTKAKFSLKRDNTGTVGFKLYDDAGCTNLLGEGTTTLHYYIPESNVMYFHQNKGLADEQILYLVFLQTTNGLIIDVNDAGPYFTQSEARSNVQGFMNDLDNRGVFLQRK